MADTAAALVIQLSADFKDFKKQMEKATGVFDAGGRKIAKRQAQIKKDLSDWSFNFTGLSKFSAAIAGLTAVGAVTGIAALVNKSLDAASAVGDIAIKAGVTTDKLQELRFGVSQAGGTFDDADEALTKFNASFGQFINTGTGRGAEAFKKLGIDKLVDSGDVRNTQQAFDAVITKIQSLDSETAKAGALSKIFGQELGPKLLQYVDQGADGIAKLSQQAHDLGLVLSGETIRGAKDAKDKLDALFQVIKAEGISAVARLAPEIGKVSQQLIDGLPALTDWVEHWADFFGLIKQSPLSKLRYELAQAQDEVTALQGQKADNTGWWKKLFGLSDEEFDTLIAAAKDKSKKLQAELNKAAVDALAQPIAVTSRVTENDNRVVSYQNAHPEALQRSQSPEEIAAAKQAQELAQRQAQALAKTKLDAATASAALIAAQDSLSVQLLKGTNDYYDADKKQIDDAYIPRSGEIDAEEDAQIASLNKQGKNWAGYQEALTNIQQAALQKRQAAYEEYQSKQDEAGPSSLVRQAIIDGDDQIRQYKEETDALGLTAGAAAKYAYVQGQLNEARRKGITLTAEEIAAIEREGDALGKAAQGASDANEKFQDAVQVSDEIRSGLSNIGVAALHGFKSAKEAAGQFLEQLAEMILQLYVMKPLLESVLGKQGTVIGGGNGSGGLTEIFSGIGTSLGFADGGVMTSRGPLQLRKYAGGGIANSPQLAMFGEGSGPEAFVPLKSGAIPVHIKVPAVPKVAAQSQSTIVFAPNIDARGAVEGTDVLIQKKLNESIGPFLAAAHEQNRRSFPTFFDQSMRDRY
jgi:hypothetical protein